VKFSIVGRILEKGIPYRVLVRKMKNDLLEDLGVNGSMLF
jgi:hypothetical protein